MSDIDNTTPAEHPTLTIGLCFEIARVLERHGFQRPDGRGADWVLACYHLVRVALGHPYRE